MNAAALFTLLSLFLAIAAEEGAAPVVPVENPGSAHWELRIIDDSSSGADGVRLGDIDGDGLSDIVTGWEEGSVTRVYRNPGPASVRNRWPAVTIGRTPSVEDAMFADINADGLWEVVSSCEGEKRTMFVHWGPAPGEGLLDPGSWKTEPIPVTGNRSQWMFAVPAQIDGQRGMDLVVGSKGDDGLIGWLESPADPTALHEWILHPLYAAGWIMSLVPTDLDGDGDIDIIASDRKGLNAGVLWLENPGSGRPAAAWKEHRIGGDGREVMFLDLADLNGDGLQDIAVAVKPKHVLLFFQPPDPKQHWNSKTIAVAFPAGLGNAKAVSLGDIDLDGRTDLVFSCEGAEPPARGVVWLSPPSTPGDEAWLAHDISGEDGIKYDRIELVDLDQDGDLDVLTCEENAGAASEGLGVIWYENPFARRDRN